jgi:hypothetical protein
MRKKCSIIQQQQIIAIKWQQIIAQNDKQDNIKIFIFTVNDDTVMKTAQPTEC